MKRILAISILVAAASSLLATEQDDPATKEKSATLPPPVGKEKFTFQQIEQQKDQLKDKIVLVEITLVGEGGTLVTHVALFRGGHIGICHVLWPSRLSTRRFEQAWTTR